MSPATTRRTCRRLAPLVVAACALAGGRPAAGAVEAAPMLTPWSAEASADPPWPEYPRPTRVRDDWLNLNGDWEYALSADGEAPPADFDGTIRVPYPLESRLSGVGRRLDAATTLWYRRAFALPPAWDGRRIHLHFGAVDWEAAVYVNGRQVGAHRGGYDAFSFDITPWVKRPGVNELWVAVRDPTEGDQPRGKQSRRPEGIFYTPSSGIWQTVWLEPTPAVHITDLQFTPEWTAHALRIRVLASTLATNLTADVQASLEGSLAGRASGPPGALITVPLLPIRPWSPDDPALYDVTVTLRRDGRILDTVRSYFGLRDIRLGRNPDGHRVLFLNGDPLFQMGVLDQGFWPDGIHTPPSDEAIRFDLQTAKDLGFNLVRKHVKVEPQRWYYWADRLGLLVWQDMPSGNNASAEGRRQFEVELGQMLRGLAPHPSIVMWVLFNEGWGQFETERLTRWIQTADPSRLVNNASGWTDAKVGDVVDLHSYPDPRAPVAESLRASVLGEFGGLGLPVEGHVWSDRTWGYQGMTDPPTLTRQYQLLLSRVWELHRTEGLAAAVYTQLTDVETECNGFLTFDRQVLKVDAARIRRANQGQLPGMLHTPLLPTAAQAIALWRYTLDAPAADWMNPAFDDTAWTEAPGGFGTPDTPGALVRTPWDTPDIWLRRRFELRSVPEGPIDLLIHHDEDAEVFLNGIPAAALERFSTGYRIIPVNPPAQAALRTGPNLLSIHCRQTAGGQYIDAGLIHE